MKHPFLYLLALLPALAFGADGELDPTYGEQGRNATGFLESGTLVLRDIARSPASARIWKFADDREDPIALYLARAFESGAPDTGFGPNGDGRRRTPLPPGLVPQAHALDLAGGAVQGDGKAIAYGGLRPRNGSTGAFPGIVCRIPAAGNFEDGYGSGGCRLLRSFLSVNEVCRVEDIAFAPGDAIVAVGNCRAEDLVERPFVTRLTTSGAIDAEFGAGAGLVAPPLPEASSTSHRFRAVAVRPDGRIVVLGEITRDLDAGLRREFGVWQFDGGGSPDAAFDGDGFRAVEFVAEGFDLAEARALVLRADGRAFALGQSLRAVDDARVALLAELDVQGQQVAGFGNGGKRVDTLDGSAGASSQLQRMELDSQQRAFVAGALVAGRPDARPHAGAEFWFQFPATVPPAFNAYLRITGDVATSGVVRSAFQDTQIPFQVQPGVITEVMLPPAFNFESQIEPLQPFAIQVTAADPVVVQPFAGRAFSTASTALLPVAQLGREYRVQTWGPNLGRGTHVVIVPALAGVTQVTVRASVAAAGLPAGTPIQFALQQGQSYHLFADDEAVDLSGTRVSADRPVAVFGGNTCAAVPNSSTDFCDQTGEQMEPLERWGTDFVGVPFATRSGDVFRVYAHDSGTEVEIDGSVVATLAAGASHTFSRSTPVRIRTSRPAAMAQFSKGCVVDQVGDDCPGDPAMLTLPPRSRWSTRQIALLPAFSVWNGNAATYRRFLNIVAPQEAVGSVTLDGVPIPAAAFAPVGDGRHAYAQLERGAGVDVVASRVPISVSVYGSSGGEAYAFQAANAPAELDLAQSDDLVLRYRADGLRDPRFGVDGIALLDHAAAYETPLASFDGAVRALPDAVGMVVGSDSINRASGQSFALDYRLISAELFRDGFESE
jgi:uncharacterized delta-60 repeat protein